MQDGWTPLRRAVDRGNESMAEMLIDKGADVNCEDNVRGATGGA